MSKTNTTRRVRARNTANSNIACLTMTPHLVDQGIDDRVSRAWLMPLDGDTHTPRPAVPDYSLPRLRLESQPLQGCRTGANQCPDGPARRSRHHARRSPAGKPRPRLLRAWTFP